MTNNIYMTACKDCGGLGGFTGLKEMGTRKEWVTCPECQGLGEVIPGYGPEGGCVCGMNNGEHSADCGVDDWLDNEPDYYVD